MGAGLVLGSAVKRVAMSTESFVWSIEPEVIVSLVEVLGVLVSVGLVVDGVGLRAVVHSVVVGGVEVVLGHIARSLGRRSGGVLRTFDLFCINLAASDAVP